MVRRIPTDLRQRYPRLTEDIERDVGELTESGVMQRALDFQAATCRHFNASDWPLFFAGDLDAEFVLIHLNPKQEDRSQSLATPDRYKDCNDYVSAYRQAGARQYGPASSGTHKSPFDHKQLRFVRPFGVIDFVEEHTHGDRLVNLERVIDRKLQLELIPYGSHSFWIRRHDIGALRPHFERVIETIAASHRRYVIFCGAVFEPLLEPYIGKVEAFPLRKADGTLTRQAARFAMVEIPWAGGRIRAGLAHSWPRQGLPMTAYAEEIKRRYRE